MSLRSSVRSQKRRRTAGRERIAARVEHRRDRVLDQRRGILDRDAHCPSECASGAQVDRTTRAQSTKLAVLLRQAAFGRSEPCAWLGSTWLDGSRARGSPGRWRSTDESARTLAQGQDLVHAEQAASQRRARPAAALGRPCWVRACGDQASRNRASVLVARVARFVQLARRVAQRLDARRDR